MHTAQRISDSVFSSQEKHWLALASDGDIDPIDIDELRAWLFQTPSRLDQTSLAAWTALAATLVWKSDDNKAHPGDGLLVRMLLDHALTVPMHVWMAEGEPLVKDTPNPNYVPNFDDDDVGDQRAVRPAYDSLLHLLALLSSSEAGLGPHPIFMEIVHSGWEPGPLLHHLDKVREMQALYIKTDRTPSAVTAQGHLIEGVLAAMGTSAWRPAPNSLWSLLWDSGMHDYYGNNSGTENELQLKRAQQRASATAAWTTFPQYAGVALAAYQESPGYRNHMKAEHFAPFPFDASHDAQTLQIWLDIWQRKDMTWNKNSTLCAGLIEHHPKVAHLLEMHCSFYTQPEDAMRDIANIAEAFQHAIGRGTYEQLSISDFNVPS